MAVTLVNDVLRLISDTSPLSVVMSAVLIGCPAIENDIPLTATPPIFGAESPSAVVTASVIAIFAALSVDCLIPLTMTGLVSASGSIKLVDDTGCVKLKLPPYVPTIAPKALTTLPPNSVLSMVMSSPSWPSALVSTNSPWSLTEAVTLVTPDWALMVAASS